MDIENDRWSDRSTLYYVNIKCEDVDPRHLPRLAGLTSDDSNAQWAAVPAKSPDWRCWENTFHGMTLFSSQWCFCCLTWRCIDNHTVIFFGCFCSLVELVEWLASWCFIYMGTVLDNCASTKPRKLPTLWYHFIPHTCRSISFKKVSEVVSDNSTYNSITVTM